MFNYEILKSFNDMEMLVYDYIMKNKFVSKNKIAPKDVKSTFQYRAYRKKGGKTLYTKWSNVVKL